MFRLTTSYPKAKRCYTWSYVENGEKLIRCRLGNPADRGEGGYRVKGNAQLVSYPKEG